LYRDILAALADAFVDTPEQTPFFTNQGTGLECFAVINDEMRRLLAERKKGVEPAAPDDAIGSLLAAEVARLDAPALGAGISPALGISGIGSDQANTVFPALGLTKLIPECCKNISAGPAHKYLK
jgi:hypothetical protein